MGLGSTPAVEPFEVFDAINVPITLGKRDACYVLGVRLNNLVAAALAMTLNMAAYGVEIMRAGLDAVPTGQWEAADSLGLTRYRVFVAVIMPQALRVIFPALSGQIIITMLESAVVSQIAVRDLTYEADLIQSRTFRAFETYAVVTVIYLVLSLVLRRVLAASGKRALGIGAG